jgi:hypothetical protein
MRPPSKHPSYKFLIKGPDSNAFEKLSHLVETLQKRYFYYVKVGITNDPELRWLQHQQQDPRWEDLVVAYETNSREEVRQLEKMITESFRLENIVMGGGGPDASGRQYLYFLATKQYNLDFPSKTGW